MAHDVRLLAVEDLAAAWELSRVAFGSERQPPPGWLEERPGRHGWGTFDGAGRLVAKAVDREQVTGSVGGWCRRAASPESRWCRSCAAPAWLAGSSRLCSQRLGNAAQ